MPDRTEPTARADSSDTGSRTPHGDAVGAALLDLDGTLLRTPALIIAEMADEAHQVTGSRPEPETAWELVGRPLEEIALTLAAGDQAQAQLIVTGYRRRYLARIVPAGERLLFPGVADGLDALRRHGWLIAVVTNKSARGAAEILHSSGLRARIDAVVGADDTPHPKPHPSPVLTALDRLGVPTTRATMIGDTVHDIIAGNAAGVRTVGVTYGVGKRCDLAAAGADVIVDDFSRVIATLAEHIHDPSLLEAATYDVRELGDRPA
ncbi:MAG: HAD-IA family hydrolase [Nocardioides sp.]|nr:HAD-IA family hydrolase [Nocardioides sp.]